MPLWDHLFKRKPSPDEPGDAYQDLIERVTLRLMTAAVGPEDDLRRAPPVGELLGLLWIHEPEALSAVQTALASLGRPPDRGFVEELAQRVQAQAPERPKTPAARYAAIVAALRAMLQVYVPLEIQLSEPMHATENVILNTHHTPLADAVRAIQILQATELHEECCSLLIVIDRFLLDAHVHKLKVRDALWAMWLESAQAELRRCLASLPADAIPVFWARAREPGTTETFWPVIERLRDRRAVPFLLEMLSAPLEGDGASPSRPAPLSQDGQIRVIAALRNIGDARAVPALRAIAANRQSLLAPIAEQAAAYILRHSQDDSARLLRPTDARHAGDAGKTLLRPASGGGSASRPDELLRPGQTPPETQK